MEKSKKKKVKNSSLKVVVRKPPSRAAKAKNEQIKKEKSSTKIKTEEPGKKGHLICNENSRIIE